ncbi:MAG TPA: UDP-N-acetylmuramoyl-L-alanyl-D-glutamate--2,6-diaminopimelate ligase [Candidatus Polarisedimenticolaceae bacterium]
MRLTSLLARAAVLPVDPVEADPEIRGVQVDSRRVRQGDLFAALRGARADGAVFVTDALKRGAAAVLAETAKPEGLPSTIAWVRVPDARRGVGLLAREWHGRPDLAMTLVGITGTNGKTTVSYLVESIAKAAGRNAGRIGTTGAAYAGLEIPSANTTPEATELFALLARMRDAGTRLVAMEVSSHALALHRVVGARFAVAAFLNLGRDHLDFHGTPEAYFEAKASLFDRLGADDTAVLPADDPLGATLARRTRGRVVTWGRGEGADIRLRNEAFDLDGGRGTIESPWGSARVETPLVGRFNLDNALAAAACAFVAGLPPAAVERGIASLAVVPGRLERVEVGQPFTVLVDYAHTPEALELALAAVRAARPRRLGVVFGCGGERDRGKRPRMGRAAASAADAVWLTSDNPRSEDPLAILDEARAGVLEVPGGAERTRVEPDRARAIVAALDWAREGDAVVIAGKGHETTQSFGDRTVPFDDREHAREALAAAGWRVR